MRHKYELHADTKIGEAVISNPYLLFLLQHFEIKIPVQDLKVNQLCEMYGLNERLFISLANLYYGSRSMPEISLEADDALTIVKFLHATHSFYSEQLYPEIIGLIEEMQQLNDHKEMKLVSVFFAEYFQEVTAHFDYENDVFHPYVEQLVKELKGENTVKRSDYSAVNYKDHHDDIEEKLNDLRSLLVKYLPEKQDYQIRRKLLFRLSELEFDLKIHSDIEELVLIPLTMKLEKQLKEKQG